MPDIFISYSHKDSTIVGELAAGLKKLGIDYFLDKKNIDWGDDIPDSVRKGLRQSGAILVVISPASLKSDWVPYEIGYGSALGLKVMPFLVHPSQDLPGYLSGLKNLSDIQEACDFFEENRDSLNAAASERHKPDVRVGISGILAVTSGGGNGHGFSITATNHSDKSVFLTGFKIDIPGTGLELLLTEDHVSGQTNSGGELKPGDDSSLCLFPDRLEQGGTKMSDLGRPLVRDKLGNTYYCSKKLNSIASGNES